MTPFHIFCLLISSIASTVYCSGRLNIRLQSDSLMNATVIMSEGANPTFIALPIILEAGKSRELGPFPIDFNKKYTLSILGGKVEQLGIIGSTHTAIVEPSRGRLSPEKLYLPLNGLELVFECDKNWSGAKCNASTVLDGTSELPQLPLSMTADYFIDEGKLPLIAKRLKEATKVENELLKRKNHGGSAIATRESSDSRELHFHDLLSSFLAIKEIVEKHSKSQFPIAVNVETDANILKSAESKTEDIVHPMIIKGLDANRRKQGDHIEEIEKHWKIQKALGMNRREPARFASWEGPRAEMGQNPIFGHITSLLNLMPRLARHTAEKQGRSESQDYVYD